VFFVHEIHSLTSGGAEAFEATLRDRWAPALAREGGTRLVWCVRSMPGAISAPELITLTAVGDGPTLERLGARVRGGDLRDDAEALAAGRVQVTRRVLAPLDLFNPLEVDLDALPLEPVEGPSEMYIHDFVPPRIGMQRTYEVAMRDAFMKMIELEGIPIVIWAGLETVAGGGPGPESLMISHIRSAEAATNLLWHANPREAIQPGTWLYDALKVRDTWRSRLLRAVPWSPMR
jgi:hypothetical protein